MGLVVKDDGWRIPDGLWERIEVLLPSRPSHPLGCHNPRVPDRQAMNGTAPTTPTRAPPRPPASDDPSRPPPSLARQPTKPPGCSDGAPIT